MIKRTKAVLLIGDGLADRPVDALDGRTPLEAAETPVLDRIAAEGECGQMDPIAPGIRAGSDTSHLAILGYDPFKVYTGRGPFEALGIGMEVRGGGYLFPRQLCEPGGGADLLHRGGVCGGDRG